MATRKQDTAFGYEGPGCGAGIVRTARVQNYRTRIRGLPFVIDEALIGVCDRCETEHYSGEETKRWRRLFEDRVTENGSYVSGAQIAGLRRKLGLNKEELARLIGCSRQSVSTWEKEDRKAPPSRTVDLILKLVGASYEEGEVDVISILLHEAESFGQPIQVRRMAVG